ncbi:MAG: phage tail protein [Actinobacteria bacterium]|nr:phage tail protein [Actinomycetota bacterium]
MATIINNRSTLVTDPLRNFRFLVTFIPQSTTNTTLTPLKTATFGFTSVSGMSVATDSIPYREGGYNTTVHQIPGQTTFTPITLQRGVILGTKQNWDWMRNLFATVGGSGTSRAVNENFRCDLEIKVLSHPVPAAGTGDNSSATDHVAMRFYVHNAWPTAVAYSDLNAGDNALFVEQMTLVHEGFDVNWAANLTTSSSSDFTVAATSARGRGSRTIIAQ